jgi:hypothetical protein
LREDGRSYRFYLTMRQPVEKLRVSLGSTQGEYDYSISVFDEVLVQGRTVKEIQSLDLATPPRYKLGEENFCTIILELSEDSAVRSELNPYRFEITLD